MVRPSPSSLSPKRAHNRFSSNWQASREAWKEEAVFQAGLEVTVELDAASDVPRSVIQFVRKTGEDIVLNDADAEERFPADAYLHGRSPLSILCVPIVYQSRPAGILYLENDLTTAAFRPLIIFTASAWSAGVPPCGDSASFWTRYVSIAGILRVSTPWRAMSCASVVPPWP